MATATIIWDEPIDKIEWRAEFYKTMSAAEIALMETIKAADHSVRINLQGLLLLRPFNHVNNETEKLLVLLDKLDRYPSTVFTQGDARMIPANLEELFKKMCRVIKAIEAAGLDKSFFLQNNVIKLISQSRKISMFAATFANAQSKLATRVPPEHVAAYQASFAAYAAARPQPSQVVHDDDIDEEFAHN
jgi:hypothetical protein